MIKRLVAKHVKQILDDTFSVKKKAWRRVSILLM